MKKTFGFILFLLVVFCIVFSNIVIAPVPDTLPPIAILTWSPEYPMVFETVTFDGCSSYDPGGGHCEKWRFDFGDGNIYESVYCSTTHEYDDDGVYTVILKVWDDEWDTDTVEHDITVYNNPPVADFTFTPFYPSTADTIQFTDTSTDMDGTIVAWSWNFGDGQTSNEQNPTYQYDHAGTYTVVLMITDDDGDTDDISKQITVTNIPPVADPNGPYEAECYEPLQLDGSGSYDTDGEIIEYFWNLGDGNTATGPYPTHTYTAEDVYTISLTVTDDEGDTDTETTTATVIDPEVNVDAGGPYSGETGITIQFTGSANSGTPPYSWFWDFDDGNTSSEQNPTHTFELPGEYTVYLSVTDSLGEIGWDTAEVNIEPSPLLVDAGGPYYGLPGDNIKFIGTAIGGTPPYNWSWDFGDETPTSNEQNPTHQYTVEDTYTATLTVTDDSSQIVCDTADVFIKGESNNPPNTPVIDGQINGEVGEEYEYTLSSTDPDGDDVSYRIDWGDDSGEIDIGIYYPSGEEQTAKHTWTEEDTYIVRVKAKDIFGAESEWGTLEVSMPKSKAINSLLLRLLENYPLIYQLIQRFFNL
jgi:PKD repeat protein